MVSFEREDQDTVFQILSNRDRRQCLIALLDRGPDEDLPLDELYQLGDTGGSAPELLFYHNHLPRMEDAGVVTWNRAEMTVSQGPAFEEIRHLVELVDEHWEELPTGRLDSPPSMSD